MVGPSKGLCSDQIAQNFNPPKKKKIKKEKEKTLVAAF